MKSKKITNKKKGGFSLIEIIIVISIVGIMTIVGINSFNSSKNSSALDASQRKIAATIRLVQSYAIQGRTQLIDDEQKVPCAYGLQFTSATEFEIFYYKKNLDGSCDSVQQKMESFSFEKNVSLDGDYAVAKIFFIIPHATASGSNIFTLKKGDDSKTVMITQNGGVVETD